MKNLLVALSLCSFYFFIDHNALAQTAPPKRIALIIGVKSYQFVQPLQNSLNDAHDIAATLKKKGFQIIELYDPRTKREMQDAIRKYFTLLQSRTNIAGLVFYSGHGMQVDGSNYLIPTQADPQIKADLDDQCLNMDYIMQAIEQAGNALNIFVLDACRNNPFRGFSRSAEKGLSMVNTPKGSYIVYATKPGSVASDGAERNGLFTSKLLKYINVEGLNIEQVFKRVASDVAVQSNDAQRPWIASDYTGDFFFTPGKGDTLDYNMGQFVLQPLVQNGADNSHDGGGTSKSAINLQDKIVTHRGDTIFCKVIELTNQTIKYKLDREDLLNSISENVVKEIKFSNGRIQKVSEKIVVGGVEDWEMVQITTNKSDVDGLVRKKELVAKATATYFTTSLGKMEKKAMDKLRKEAAAMGCHIVLIVSSVSRDGGYAKGNAKSNLTGVPYSY